MVCLDANERASTPEEIRHLHAGGRSSSHVRLHGLILPVVDVDAVLDIAGLLGNEPFNGSNKERIVPKAGGPCYLEMAVECMH